MVACYKIYLQNVHFAQGLRYDPIQKEIAAKSRSDWLLQEYGWKPGNYVYPAWEWLSSHDVCVRF
jgi:hypothetical protein